MIGDHFPTGAILIAAVLGQMSVAVFTGAETLVSRFAPPPIEGIGRAPAEVQAGETVVVHWRIAKRTDCPGVNSRVWHGSDGFEMREPQRPTALPSDPGWQTYAVQTAIPADAPPGPLSLSIVGAYTCAGTTATPFALGPVLMTVTE